LSSEKSAIEQVLKVARDVRDGRLSAVEGAHLLFPEVVDNSVLSEADARTISAVVSETDTLPFGEVRRLWGEAALHERDELLRIAEERWRTKILGICERILQNETC